MTRATPEDRSNHGMTTQGGATCDYKKEAGLRKSSATSDDDSNTRGQEQHQMTSASPSDDKSNTR